MTDPAQIADQIQRFAVLSVLIIPVIIGLTEVVKRAGVPIKWVPVTALAFGIAASFLLLGVSAITTFMGVIYGLSACGLFSGTKTVAQAFTTSTPTPEPTSDQPSDTPPPPAA